MKVTGLAPWFFADSALEVISSLVNANQQRSVIMLPKKRLGLAPIWRILAAFGSHGVRILLGEGKARYAW